MRRRRCDSGQNKKHFSKLNNKGFSNVYSTFLVEGLNLSNLLNKLKKEGVEVFNAKLVKAKVLSLCIKISDEQKFFAITNILCYNVKKVKNRGKFLFLYNLLRSPSLCLGVAIFIALSVCLSNFVLGFTFVGNGSRYKNQVISYLNDNGIREKAFLDKVDLDKLSSGILSRFDEFSFVSCKKNGNRLLIELVLSDNQTHIKKDGEKDLYSTVSGVVEEIKVYRGTPSVSVGDRVDEGSLLVSGYMDIKDKRVEVNALAVVTVKASKEFTYISESSEYHEEAKAFALASFNEEASDVFVDKSQLNGKYYYKVTIYYKRVIYTG